MNLFAAIFYVLGAIIVIATGMAVTRRRTMHAVVYAVVSFFATAALFGLLGAPLLAVFEVIIYAGAIMVLFLFIIMLIPRTRLERDVGGGLRWLLPGILSLVILACVTVLTVTAHGSGQQLHPAMASPSDVGRALYVRYWLVVEFVSFLLFMGLAGACFLGRRQNDAKEERP